MNGITKIYRNNIGITFVLPAVIAYSLFVVVSISTTVWYSFFEWNGINPKMKFVAFDNFITMLQDEIFWKALQHNLMWIFASMTIPLLLGFILAMFISLKEIKYKTLFKTVYFMPLVLSFPIVGVIWEWVYSPGYGVIKSLIDLIGLKDVMIPWLGDEFLVLPAVFIAGLWAGLGFNVVVLLAALQSIDPMYYESSTIEGANKFQTTVYITIPLLKNILLMLLINALINAFKVFDIIFVMTQGGPYNASEVIATYMYNQTFNQFHIGYGAALATTLTVIIAIASYIYIRITDGGEEA